MNFTIEDRWDRIENTTHVVRVDDMTVYRVRDLKLIDGDLIFVETDSGLWFQDLDIMTLEEMSHAERACQWIKDKIIAQ